MANLQTRMSKKLTAPDLDTKYSAPPSESMMAGMPSISELVESTNMDSTGIKEVLNAPDTTTAIKQTVTHPIMLLALAGVVYLVMTSGKRR